MMEFFYNSAGMMLCMVLPFGGCQNIRDAAKTAKGSSKWWEKIQKAKEAGEAQGQGDILKQQLTMLGSMPREQQLDILRAIGESIQESGDGKQCNIFGGQDSCMRISKQSNFASWCPHTELKVDCAYYSETLVEIDEDPREAIKKEMIERGDGVCDECVHNQMQLWCNQAVPPCGSFQNHVETAMLPAMEEMAVIDQDYNQAGDTAASQLAVVAKAIPVLISAMSLSMPCKEMCNAVVDTCGCGKSSTFGDLVTQGPFMKASNIDPAQTKEVFGEAPPANASNRGWEEGMTPPNQSPALQIWDTQICDLYTSKNDPDFNGRCDVAGIQHGTCSWCNDNTMAQFTEVQLASMLAEEVSGWVFGPMGLFKDASELQDEGDYGELGDEEDDEIRHHGGHHHHEEGESKVAVVVTVFVCLGVLGIASAAGFMYYKKHVLADASTGYSQMEPEGGWIPADPPGGYAPMQYEAPGMPLGNVLGNDEL